MPRNPQPHPRSKRCFDKKKKSVFMLNKIRIKADSDMSADDDDEDDYEEEKPAKAKKAPAKKPAAVPKKSEVFYCALSNFLLIVRSRRIKHLLPSPPPSRPPSRPPRRYVDQI